MCRCIVSTHLKRALAALLAVLSPTTIPLMPVYRRCLNQDCGWKNSCREFFTLEEFKGPSIIPPSVKCACGCFRAQHERVDVRPFIALELYCCAVTFPKDKDPQSRDSMPSAAPPSATQGSTLPHSSPLHPFINKFVPAANAAAAAATERLDGFNQHRVQTAVCLASFLAGFPGAEAHEFFQQAFNLATVCLFIAP